MNRLVGDLLDMASLDAGRLSLHRQPTTVGQLVSDVVETIGPLADDKSIRLEVDLPRELPVVTADCARVHQVLANILGNAVKFTPEQGTITLRCEPLEAEVRFSVADTGPGISAEDIPHLFDRFWQAPGTARLGTGLGLSIANNLVQAHGGRIWVESQPGEGATFFFTLPLAPPKLQDEQSEPVSLH